MVEHLGSVLLSLPEMAGVPGSQALTWVDLVWLTLRKVRAEERRSRTVHLHPLLILGFYLGHRLMGCCCVQRVKPRIFFLFLCKNGNDLDDYRIF